MTKGILLIIVFAGWFLVKNQSNREILFSDQLSFSAKTEQIIHSWKEQVWHRSATSLRKTPAAIPLPFLYEKKYCLRTIVHLPELKDAPDSSNLYPLTPMLIHSL